MVELAKVIGNDFECEGGGLHHNVSRFFHIKMYNDKLFGESGKFTLDKKLSPNTFNENSHLGGMRGMKFNALGENS